VSYAGAYAPERFNVEWEVYDRESFALLARVNSLLSISGTLFSPATVARLRRFSEDWLEQEFDHSLSTRARKKAAQQEWKEWHNPHHAEAEAKTSELLAAVADEAGLSYSRRRSN
jgi:hypothetical protein